MIRVQTIDFSVADEYQQLLKPNTTGAAVMFVGCVRDFTTDANQSFLLQHYPGMTESVLERIDAYARSRWNLIETRIIHRVGELKTDDQIVFVGVSSAHRADAFSACEFIIDTLKTEAPFWKKEGSHWVEAKASDQSRAERWLQPGTKPGK